MLVGGSPFGTGLNAAGSQKREDNREALRTVGEGSPATTYNERSDELGSTDPIKRASTPRDCQRICLVQIKDRPPFPLMNIGAAGEAKLSQRSQKLSASIRSLI